MTKIRFTNQADTDALADVAEAAGIFPGTMLPDMLGPYLAGEQSGFWLTCEIDGSPSGFVYTQQEPMADGTWNMLALAVHPSAHRQGQGRALVHAVEEELRRRQARLVIVDTSSTGGYAMARAFYHALGYEAEARIRDYWDTGDHKITFRKPL